MNEEIANQTTMWLGEQSQFLSQIYWLKHSVIVDTNKLFQEQILTYKAKIHIIMVSYIIIQLHQRFFGSHAVLYSCRCQWQGVPPALHCHS